MIRTFGPLYATIPMTVENDVKVKEIKREILPRLTNARNWTRDLSASITSQLKCIELAARGGEWVPLWGKKKLEVPSVAKNEIRQKLLALNNPSNPFEIGVSDETDLFITEKIVDAQWREGALGFTEKQLKRGYKAWLLLDEESHEGRLNEEKTTDTTEKKGPFGLGGMSSHKSTFRGKILYSKEGGSRGSPFGGKKDYEYHFDIRNVHDPIKKTLEENGWNFKQVFTKGEATYKK